MKYVNRDEERKKLKENIRNNQRIILVVSETGIGKSSLVNTVLEDEKCNTIRVKASPNDLSSDYSFIRFLGHNISLKADKYGYSSFEKFVNRQKKINKTKQNITAGLFYLFFKNSDLISESLKKKNEETYIIFNQTIELVCQYINSIITQKKLIFFIENSNIISKKELALLCDFINRSLKCCYILEYNKNKSSDAYEETIDILKSISTQYYLLEVNKLSRTHIKEIINNTMNDKTIPLPEDLLIAANLHEILCFAKNLNDTNINKQDNKKHKIEDIIRNFRDDKKAIFYAIYIWKKEIEFNTICDLINNYMKLCYEKNQIKDIILDFQEKYLLTFEDNERIIINDYIKNNIFFNEKGDHIQLAVISSIRKFCSDKIKFYSDNESNANKYRNILLNISIQYDPINIIESISYIDYKLKKCINRTEAIDFIDKVINSINVNKCLNHPAFNDLCDKLINIAYQNSLYNGTYDLMNLRYKNGYQSDKYILYKSVILNRLERFNESIDWINSSLNRFPKHSEEYVILQLSKMMSLKQLNKKTELDKIYNKLYKNRSIYKLYNIYPYLLRFSATDKYDISDLKEAIELIKTKNDEINVAQTLINLCVEYTVNKKYDLARNCLEEAIKYLGECRNRNSSILQNYASISLKQIIENNGMKCDPSIKENLESALITADTIYAKLAIYNNLLVYYLINENVYSGIKIAQKLENILKTNEYRRFEDNVMYNLYLFYIMSNDKGKAIAIKSKIKNFSENQKPYLMYSTFWQFPLDENYSSELN